MLKDKNKKIIGFWGYLYPDIIKTAKEKYKNAEFVDLDIDYGYKKTAILPDNYCAIMKNIINNAYFLKDNLIEILAPIGKDKCDCAFFASEILTKEGFKVIQTKFEDTMPAGVNVAKVKTPISDSVLPLKEKINLITKNIIEQKDYSYLVQDLKQRHGADFEKSNGAKFGFWGVPPNDLNILDLFPNSTRVFGWTRCVEANYPADVNLEMFVEPELATVFFAQTFCAKNQLAKYLADKYNGLYIDIDGTPNASTIAKIEAFLRLR